MLDPAPTAVELISFFLRCHLGTDRLALGGNAACGRDSAAPLSHTCLVGPRSLVYSPLSESRAKSAPWWFCESECLDTPGRRCRLRPIPPSREPLTTAVQCVFPHLGRTLQSRSDRYLDFPLKPLSSALSIITIIKIPVIATTTRTSAHSSYRLSPPSPFWRSPSAAPVHIFLPAFSPVDSLS